jgi:hypothetical protein
MSCVQWEWNNSNAHITMQRSQIGIVANEQAYI